MVNPKHSQRALRILAGAGLLGLCIAALWTLRDEECREPAFRLGIASGWGSATEVRMAGATSLRSDVPWGEIEREAGRLRMPRELGSMIHAARQVGAEPLGILDYGNAAYDGGLFPVSGAARAAFARYAAFTVGALDREVSLWEVWNEWNLPCGMPAGVPPGRPEDYVALAAGTYATLKTKFPKKTILGGAVAGIGRKDDWTRRALDAGLLRHLDGFSFHPYVYWMSPRERVPERGLMDLVHELETLLARYPGGKETPLYVTELGWPTHDAPDGVTLDQQAKYLARALLLLRADPRIRGVWVYTLRDHEGNADDREAHFGLLFPDGSPKPAWFAFRDTADLLREARECRRLVLDPLEEGLNAVEIVTVLGRRDLVLWAERPEDLYRVTWRGASTVWPMRTRLLGAGTGPRGPIEQGGFTVSVSDRPLVLEGIGKEAVVDLVESETILERDVQ